MKMSAVEINGGKLAKSIDMKVEINVTGMRWLRFRMWLGSKIILFGGWVVGVGRCEVVTK